MFRFDNTFARDLPELCRPWTAATAPSPRLLALDEALATELCVDPAVLRSPAGVDVLVGNVVPDGAEPVAQAYAGHQFGGYSPLLGDGRALLVGEVIDTAGTRRDLHLKGSGRTPFARGGDGLAAVGPMLREFLMGHAMHALGVRTTRALAVVATGAEVHRETTLPGAVMARVASSHLRVGTFQYASALGGTELMTRLVDHAVARHHPEAAATERPALALLQAVVDAQADLVAHWMSIGFIHGVMNTDNVTISGETIDYGPCAFMDTYDRATVFSSIDRGGRYAFGNQPTIMQWNLARLAEALLELIDPDTDTAIAMATEVLEGYRDAFWSSWTRRLVAKTGLEGGPEDEQLVLDWLDLLETQQVDLTTAMRSLSAAVQGDEGPTRALFREPEPYEAWAARWSVRRAEIGADPEAVAAEMDRHNPIYIPRNHLVEAALDAATEGDLGPFDQLLQVLADPFTEQPDAAGYQDPAPADGPRHVTFCGT